MITINVPLGWEGGGRLPEVSHVAATDAELRQFKQDLVQLRSTQGPFTIDVGWYPAIKRDGEFVCRVIERQDWDAPREELITKSTPAVLTWIQDAITRINYTTGERQALVQRAALTLELSRWYAVGVTGSAVFSSGVSAQTNIAYPLGRKVA